jgi:hypothetical protein
MKMKTNRRNWLVALVAMLAALAIVGHALAQATPVTGGTNNGRSATWTNSVTLTNNSASTAFTLAVPSGFSEQAEVQWICRAVSGSGVTAGDTWATTWITAFKNVGGTTTFTSSGSTVLSTLSDTSMASVAAGFSLSGGNVDVQVTGLASVTMVCVVTARILEN